MKKFSALMIGAAMVLGTAAFAAQKPADKSATDSTTTTTTKVKKHHKTKKTVKKDTSAPAATPAPAK